MDNVNCYIIYVTHIKHFDSMDSIISNIIVLNCTEL